MRIYSLFLLFFLGFSSLTAQPNYVEDTQATLELLDKERSRLKLEVENKTSDLFQNLTRLQDLGDWSFVQASIEKTKSLSKIESTALFAKAAWFANDFVEMQALLDKLSKNEQKDSKIQNLLATLEIEAWELEKAEAIAKQASLNNKNDLEAERVLSRALILQKKYKEALAIAEARIARDPEKSIGYFLKADVFFWNQDPVNAEKALVQGLQIDPLNADARFFYGYAIWRRIDATQINAMVAQWEVALALNPLHFQTHWHMGNGHTNKTFIDYADPQEDEIRQKLAEVDSLFSTANKQQAIALTKEIANQYPNSVLPSMHHASLLYSDFDAKDRVANLKEAENLFLDILKVKEHYGPAHNGLSAVIKSQRIPYLSSYKAIQDALEGASITNEADLLELFPDVAYYPGNVAKAMVWNQLYAAVVYFPFLVEQARTFVIPPLHEDLALSMKNSYFRFNTTFDNRQWMDIRGVGSGAASIEYTERGAYGERNVLLHEYVHLFHSVVTTDSQNRRIRELYYNAMENGLTLDYYSQNNESEYFAQTYPAYFEEVKVHPLDFKSMNTTSDLKQKDPLIYAFLDELVSKERAYLNGDKEAMASNWAQVQVNLSRKYARTNIKKVYEHLDRALDFDSEYLPAHIAYARQLLNEKKYPEAYARIAIAKDIDASYAPIYRLEADWLVATKPEAIKEQAALYKKAYDMETDYMEKASNSSVLRNFYYNQDMLPEALEVADEYVQQASVISTYLRDNKEAAEAFSAWQRALAGDKEQLKSLAYLISQRPHNYGMRVQYAEALIANKEYNKVEEVLLTSYKNLQASRVNRTDFELLLAEAYEGLGDKANTKIFLDKILEKDSQTLNLDALSLIRLANLLERQGELKKATAFLNLARANKSPLVQNKLKRM